LARQLQSQGLAAAAEYQQARAAVDGILVRMSSATGTAGGSTNAAGRAAAGAGIQQSADSADAQCATTAAAGAAAVLCDSSGCNVEAEQQQVSNGCVGSVCAVVWLFAAIST
jgi:hypothetical protein